jgi:hypothetical protein
VPEVIIMRVSKVFLPPSLTRKIESPKAHTYFKIILNHPEWLKIFANLVLILLFLVLLGP